LPVPNEWYSDEYKKDHELKPNYVNNIIYGIISEYESIYKTDKYYDGYTVAMLMARNGILPPKEL
jgi:hypothetical protein